jgi:valyl-tRNA synthetase
MLTRLREGIAEIDRALATYQFSAYAKALYDLVRRDFCDWYLEAVKSTIADNPAQQGCLRLVLDSLLRVLHPVVPFITETIHERLARSPRRRSRGSRSTRRPTAMSSPPPAGPPSTRRSPTRRRRRRSSACARSWTRIRAVRSANQVEPRRRVALHASGELAGEIAAAGGLVESLAGLHTVTGDAPGDAIRGVHARRRRAPTRGPRRRARPGAPSENASTKEKADLEKSIKALEGRLSNPGYTEKAPPHLVQQTRDEHAKAKAPTSRPSIRPWSRCG